MPFGGPSARINWSHELPRMNSRLTKEALDQGLCIAASRSLSGSCGPPSATVIAPPGSTNRVTPSGWSSRKSPRAGRGGWAYEPHRLRQPPYGAQASTSDGSIAAAGISRRQLVSGNVEASCRGHRTLGLTTPTVVPLSFSWKSRRSGVARSLGWKVHMRCANGYRQETRSMRRCVYRKQLDLETLVATRGPNFPLSRLKVAPHVSSLWKSKGDGGV